MKSFPQYFLSVFALLFLAVFGNMEIVAQPKSSTSYAKVKVCLDENEPAYNASVNQEPTPESTERSRSILEKLIGCVDTGLKIKTLSVKQRRSLQVRKTRYISDRETSKFLDCAALRMIEVDTKLTTEVEKRVNAKDKAGALERLQAATSMTLEAKSCVQQALDSALVPPNVKTELQGTMQKLISLLASFDSLRKRLETMPDK